MPTPFPLFVLLLVLSDCRQDTDSLTPTGRRRLLALPQVDLVQARTVHHRRHLTCLRTLDALHLGSQVRELSLAPSTLPRPSGASEGARPLFSALARVSIEPLNPELTTPCCTTAHLPRLLHLLHVSTEL